MNEKIKRVYVDSSVVSGVFDKNDHPEKTEPFWKAVFSGKFRAVLSDVLDDEVERAPPHVRDFYRSIPELHVERIVLTPESDTLARRYIKAGIISQNHFTDCKHVALAAITCVDVLVSWNTRHIVNQSRTCRFNDVSIGFGCDKIIIQTPENLTPRGE
jgi:predicted nucleic acid-binding protein